MSINTTTPATRPLTRQTAYNQAIFPPTVVNTLATTTVSPPTTMSLTFTLNTSSSSPRARETADIRLVQQSRRQQQTDGSVGTAACSSSPLPLPSSSVPAAASASHSLRGQPDEGLNLSSLQLESRDAPTSLPRLSHVSHPHPIAYASSQEPSRQAPTPYDDDNDDDGDGDPESKGEEQQLGQENSSSSSSSVTVAEEIDEDTSDYYHVAHPSSSSSSASSQPPPPAKIQQHEQANANVQTPATNSINTASSCAGQPVAPTTQSHAPPLPCTLLSPRPYILFLSSLLFLLRLLPHVLISLSSILY